jgi:hypothetical protein
MSVTESSCTRDYAKQKPQRTYGEHRICAQQGCDTRLNRYNSSVYCQLHGGTVLTAADFSRLLLSERAEKMLRILEEARPEYVSLKAHGFNGGVGQMAALAELQGSGWIIRTYTGRGTRLIAAPGEPYDAEEVEIEPRYLSGLRCLRNAQPGAWIERPKNISVRAWQDLPAVARRYGYAVERRGATLRLWPGSERHVKRQRLREAALR